MDWLETEEPYHLQTVKYTPISHKESLQTGLTAGWNAANSGFDNYNVQMWSAIQF